MQNIRVFSINLILISTAICFFSPTLAQNTPNLPIRGPLTFEDFDQNRDGHINSEEFTAVSAARATLNNLSNQIIKVKSFNDFDQNKDGKITPTEFALLQKLKQQKRQ